MALTFRALTSPCLTSKREGIVRAFHPALLVQPQRELSAFSILRALAEAQDQQAQE